MKIGEARETYFRRFRQLRSRRDELEEQCKKAECSGDTEKAEAVRAEFNKADRQYKTASGFMERFNLYTDALYRNEAAKKDRKKTEEKLEDTEKCLEIARRISRGDKVPYEDEQKLMNYNRAVYMLSKSMAIMNINKKHKEYRSLWKDKEPSPEDRMSTDQIVDNMDCTMEMPAFAMTDTPSETE